MLAFKGNEKADSAANKTAGSASSCSIPQSDEKVPCHQVDPTIEPTSSKCLSSSTVPSLVTIDPVLKIPESQIHMLSMSHGCVCTTCTALRYSPLSKDIASSTASVSSILSYTTTTVTYNGTSTRTTTIRSPSGTLPGVVQVDVPIPTIPCDDRGLLQTFSSATRVNTISAINFTTGESTDLFTLNTILYGNSLGCNHLDNYLYTFLGFPQNETNAQLIRIGQHGGFVPLTSLGPSAGADTDANGQMWTTLFGRSWTQIDLNPSSPTYGTIVGSGVSGGAVVPSIADWSFVIGGGSNLYSVSITADAFSLDSFDTTTHIWTLIRNFGTVRDARVVPATFAGSPATIIGDTSADGAVYQVAIDRSSVTRLNKTLPANVNADGARCLAAAATAPLPTNTATTGSSATISSTISSASTSTTTCNTVSTVTLSASSTAGQTSTVVPPACATSVSFFVVGGGGGVNGRGTNVTGSIPFDGGSLALIVGGAGARGAAGAAGQSQYGSGGTGRNGGGGGGGASALYLNGSLLVVAGGGGGQGGPYANAFTGQPTNLAQGQDSATNDGGGFGRSRFITAVNGGGRLANSRGGSPGTATGPGVGGTHDGYADEASNGNPGVGSRGGNGIPNFKDDPNDQNGGSGGGGGGYFGGGSGANLIYRNGNEQNIAAGGGGGSSFIASTVLGSAQTNATTSLPGSITLIFS